MSETIIKIGGRDVTVPELNYKALKKIYPLIQRMEADTKEDNIESVMDLIVDFLEIALRRSPTPLTKEELEDQLLISELPGLQAAVESILSNNGLKPKPGE